MLLSDMGAEVIRVERPNGTIGVRAGIDLLNRGRRSISIDLKSPEGCALTKRLISTADGLFEGFRPGVMERLGLGPRDCHLLKRDVNDNLRVAAVIGCQEIRGVPIVSASGRSASVNGKSWRK
jgi:crotonobetainyl-CoA:carnitine CoA-transferase CaiB-like acyl-CoA transferase